MSDRASLQRLLGDLDADCPLQNDVIKKQIVSLFDVVMDEQFDEIARLQLRITTLERNMERETEKMDKKQDWVFDFVIENITEKQADDLVNQIVDYAEECNALFGGGYAPVNNIEAQKDISELAAKRALIGK
jgi:hypothetical protein